MFNKQNDGERCFRHTKKKVEKNSGHTMSMAITLAKLLLKLSLLQRLSTIVASGKTMRLRSAPAKKVVLKKILGAQAKMHLGLAVSGFLCYSFFMLSAKLYVPSEGFNTINRDKLA